jgi:hypothetical protein
LAKYLLWDDVLQYMTRQMKTYNENAIVIYTDDEGNRYDTFVIFDTDTKTGLTHINHFNLKVNSDSLELHPNSLTGSPMPLADPLSFELFNKLKSKYTHIDKKKKVAMPALYAENKLAKAS